MNLPALIYGQPNPPQGEERRIGEILVAHGRLSPQDAARVINRQKLDQRPFGEVALELKVISRSDIEFALSKQFDYPYLIDKDTSLSADLIAAYQPFSQAGENLRAVRSQLMLRWFNNDAQRKVLAVVSPGQGDGRSFIAANLAIVFAQHGERTLLIDGDLRSPRARGQHALFKLTGGTGLSAILAGRAGMEVAQAVPGLPGLVVLPAGAIPPNPQELLGRMSFPRLLTDVSDAFDVILIDTPSGMQYADAEIIASRAGAAMMVTRRNQSLLPDAALLARRLRDDDVALVGAVLNDA
ncbi:chain-length determining protein [Hylemonella gracilis str. Niagara R]|uniref:Chain-length determining protein n=1 Tax=Hylemonella gracilis str. Niagara R TaxID=1458275 RepID=A0A016XK79_9BURK|nr:chain length determinant protein tyrosine kinase EpsG [Hylemonella gracilis]EYC51962.1 chain-length determining protein [Hylemonella gracilis str. Niagara R]